jgi:hypothetical protein
MPAAFRVDVTAAFEALIADETSVTIAPGLRGIVPAVVLRDGDGVIHRVAGSRIAVGLGAQSVEVPLTVTLPDERVVTPAAPLELLAFNLRIELPPGALATGSLTLDALDAIAGDGTATAIDVSGIDGITATEQEPLTGFGAADSTSLDLPIGTAPPETPIPALASAGYLERTGVLLGDVVEVGQLTQRRSYEIVGSLRGFPTLDPNEAFLVVDLPDLAAWELADGGTLGIAEWWLATEAGAGSGVAETLRADPFSASSILVRDEVERGLVGDPVALGLIGALALGALAAVVFASIGFIVSATVSARERLGEFALLQAIGLSHRQLSAWISLENAFLLLIGLVSGTGLGLVLAWVVLPFVTLTQEATLAVPPVEVVIPWGIYGLIYVVALAALAITVVVIGNLLGRVRVSGVLRSGGE